MEQWLHSRAKVRESRGLVRRAAPLPTGRVLDLASNDYLGLSRDPRLTSAAIAAVLRHGSGSRASPVVCGMLAVHAELENALCQLTGAETALPFSSGYLANLGVLTALGGPGTLLVLDAHVHASLHDAARLSRSPVVIVPHGDVEAVRAALAARMVPRAVVVVESLYSVLGDAAELTVLAEACAAHDAWLLVDEAHGIGVAGGGRGAVHAAGLAAAPHVVLTVTLSKALGSQGGAVLGPPELREHLVNSARPFIFDTALAPAPAASAAEAARIILAEPALAARLHVSAARLAGMAGITGSPGAVQSIPMASAEQAVSVAGQLRDAGMLVGCFRPPSVPDGVSRLRLTARADLSPSQLDDAARLLRHVLPAPGRSPLSGALPATNPSLEGKQL
ncbi:MAG: 8-amino-7-oxononanoate synthase [Arthrobacter sp.]|nr:8-amino-7-oxononanoate synthase [Arthrobacter sp.]MDO5752675.1 8-amino-7-oxononanoate synthase [Arthrobacter sp.]